MQLMHLQLLHVLVPINSMTSKHLLISAQKIVSQELHKSNISTWLIWLHSRCHRAFVFKHFSPLIPCPPFLPQRRGRTAWVQHLRAKRYEQIMLSRWLWTHLEIRCSVSLQGHNLGGLRIMLHRLQYISIPYPTTAARSSLIAASVQYITKAFQGSYVIKTTNSVTNCQKSRDATGTQEHHGVITKIWGICVFCPQMQPPALKPLKWAKIKSVSFCSELRLATSRNYK